MIDHVVRPWLGPARLVFGAAPDARLSPEWAAWANAVAVRELDFHDAFLAADSVIAEVMAVADAHPAGARLPDLDADELADLALPGLAEAAEQPETWGIL